MPEESQEQPQEARPEEKSGDKFGYLRGDYESPIRRAQRAFGKSTFKTLLEKREQASTQEEKEEINRLIKEKRAEKKRTIHEFKTLEDLSYRDFLTGLPNKSGLQNSLERELLVKRRADRARRRGEKEYVSVLGMMDVDGLKEVNDKEGHRGGDEYIKRVANILRSVTRPTDTVAREGGDEFRVLLQGADMEGAKEYYKRLENKLREAGIGMSVGFSPFDPNEIEASKELSDIAMYKAKSKKEEKGKSHLVTADSLTAEEVQAGAEAMQKRYNLR